MNYEYDLEENDSKLTSLPSYESVGGQFVSPCLAL